MRHCANNYTERLLRRSELSGALNADVAGNRLPRSRSCWLHSIALVIACIIATTLKSEQITLLWDYPTNELTGVTFRVRHATNITTTNWVVIATTTNLFAKVDVPRGVNFFIASASNFWGEGMFSNLLKLPPVVQTNVPFGATRP